MTSNGASDALADAIQQLSIADDTEAAAEEVARIAAEEDANAREWAIEMIARICDNITKTQAEDMVEEHRVEAAANTIDIRRVEKILPAASNERTKYRFHITANSAVHGEVNDVIELESDETKTPSEFETQLMEITDQVISLGGKEEFQEFLNRQILDVGLEIVEEVPLSNEHELIGRTFQMIQSLIITTDWDTFAENTDSCGLYDPGDGTLKIDNSRILNLTKQIDGDVNATRAHHMMEGRWLADRARTVNRGGHSYRLWIFDADAIAENPGIDIAERADRDDDLANDRAPDDGVNFGPDPDGDGDEIGGD